MGMRHPHTGGISEEMDTTLNLFLFNQSDEIGLVDFVVRIDGEKLLEHDAAFGRAMDGWRIALQPGTHTIEVSSERGDAHFMSTFTMSGEMWAIVDYWYSRSLPKQFLVELARNRPSEVH